MNVGSETKASYVGFYAFYLYDDELKEELVQMYKECDGDFFRFAEDVEDFRLSLWEYENRKDYYHGVGPCPFPDWCNHQFLRGPHPEELPRELDSRVMLHWGGKNIYDHWTLEKVTLKDKGRSMVTTPHALIYFALETLYPKDGWELRVQEAIQALHALMEWSDNKSEAIDRKASSLLKELEKA